MVKKLFAALPTLALLAGVALAQDAKTVLQNATKAMGDVKSIQFSGTGHLAAVGQAWNPTSPWPETIVKSYSRTIDYGSQSSREELVRNEGDPPAKGGASPSGLSSQRQIPLHERRKPPGRDRFPSRRRTPEGNPRGPGDSSRLHGPRRDCRDSDRPQGALRLRF